MQPAIILVVDDDAVARELLAEALKKEGYAVEAFASGEEVIARGRQGRVDLVLTDIRMGAVDGLTVLREFKRMSPDTAVVVLTSFGSLEGAIEAIKQGAYDYLAKPFKKDLHFEDVRKLLEVLHELVDQGNTVVVIEHNLDVIKTADWVIDIGPEGGDGGGEIVATGTPEIIAKVDRSHTGRYLKDMLKDRRVAAE